MNKLTMFSGKEFLIDDQEAEAIKANFNNSILIELKSGETINTKGVESIIKAKKEYWENNEVFKSRDGARFFCRDGQRIVLGEDEIKQITIKDFNNYKLIN